MRFTRAIFAVLAVCLSFSTPNAKADDDAPKNPFKGLELRNIGPAFTSGRISDIAVHPYDQSTWYIGVGSGGVWKTENAGTTWDPIFDSEGSYSIGCITIDPSHPEIVWVGTGENIAGRHVAFGDGVYKSLDGGKTWKNMGLGKSEHIGNIVVHPEDPQTVYVAAQGPVWSAGGDRGLFKTIDGGETWQRILSAGEHTGVSEVHMDPRDPDVLYAATYQHFRNVAVLMAGGPESAIHKSIDGGATWRELKEGLPKGDKGKIGLAISPQNPDVIYATVELPHRKGAFYRSSNGGGSWVKGQDYAAGGTGPHYYNELFASPHQFDRIYQMDVRLHVSEDGGKAFRNIQGRYAHVDNHAMAFDPADPDYLLVGCDGGLYESWDLGKTWKFISNLPVTQYYKVAVDYDEPFYNIYGGTQDNNSHGGPSRTDNIHGIRNSDWFVTLGGDGHQSAVDPTNPDITYAESQRGNLSRYDRTTGESIFIQPQPGEGEPTERFNWDAPILISPHDPATLYFASHRVWRSDNRGDSWRAISGDLTRKTDRLVEPVMGRVWSFDAAWDLYAMSQYGTITSLAESPVDANVLYAGTDDGLIQVTEDAGQTWRAISRLPKTPEFFFVNDIKADLHDANTVYVAVDDHKSGDFAPYLLKSTDRGRSWKSIAGDLPERHVVWRVVQDHVKPELMFAGTEFGVFFTLNGGGHWTKLEGGVPNISFRDLAIQKRENDLVGATFGRGFFVLDDYSPLREVSDDMLKQDAHLFPVRDALWYVEKRSLGGRKKASQGDAFYVAPNPPFGATFTYYLRDDIQTRKDARRKAEKKRAKDGGDNPTPGWDALLEEQLEDTPAVVLTVSDGRGNVVRRIEGPVKAGFHRVSWDLHYPPIEPVTGAPTEPGGRRNRGYLAAPGTYTVALAIRKDGVVADAVASQSFEVVPMRQNALATASPEQIAAFSAEVADLGRALQGAESAIAEARVQTRAIKAALLNSGADAALDVQVRSIDRRLQLLQETLAGNRERDLYNDQHPVHIKGRLRVAQRGIDSSTYGPTAMHRSNFAMAKRDFAALAADLLQIIDRDLPELMDRLDDAGVPWTPGRAVGTR